MLRGRVPIARLNLIHNKARMAASLAGITFAVVLMFMETGFDNALMDGVVKLVEDFDCDLIMTSRSRASLNFKVPFARRHLDEAMQFEEVVSATPIHLEASRSQWRSRETGLEMPVRVVAFNPEAVVFVDPMLQARMAELRPHASALFDRACKLWVYGHPRPGDRTELAGKAINVVGEFSIGADMVNDGTLLMSDRNYLHYFGGPRLHQAGPTAADLGLIRVRPGSAETMKRRLTLALPPSVEVSTKEEYIAREQTFWRRSTPVGMVFGLGKALGFIVGVIICYQILFSEISSYLREYATLLAMGYRRVDLVRVVLAEACYLSCIGFACGFLVSYVLYRSVQHLTALPFQIRPDRVAWLFVETVVMCLVSAGLAVRKLWSADPVELF